MKMLKKESLAFGAMMLVLGMVIMAAIDRWPTSPKPNNASPATRFLTDSGITVVTDYPNPAIVEFVLAEPIAPFYYIGEGDVDMIKWNADPDNQKRWDPLQVGVIDALSLIDKIRQGVPGLEGGMAPNGITANGYTVRITITGSHIGQKDEIIEQVISIINDFEENR